MCITIIYYCLISTLRFVKTTLLHTPFNLYHPLVILYFFNTSSLQDTLLLYSSPKISTLLNLFINFVTAVKLFHGPSISKKLTSNSLSVCNLWFQGTLQYLKMRHVCVDFEPCSKRYSFVSIHSKIIKLEKINDASYSNLPCGKVRLLIPYNLKLTLVPCTTSEWPKVLCSFF